MDGRHRRGLTAALLGALAGCSTPIGLEDAPCPCIEGFRCCAATGRCARGCPAGDDAGASADAGDAPDAGPGACPGATPDAYGFVRIPAGTFVASAPPGELGRDDRTEGAIEVELTRPFLLAAHEVTQREWKALSGGVNPSCFQQHVNPSCLPADANDDAPVEQVSWWSALAYLDARSAREGLAPCHVLPASCTGDWRAGSLNCLGDVTLTAPDLAGCEGYRLPTEAEWERAARACVGAATHAGELTASDCDDATLPPVAWFCGNAGGQPRAVGTRTPNGYGLFDMLGNVAEWTWDRVERGPPTGGRDPAGTPGGPLRVRRGGHHVSPASGARASSRILDAPGIRNRTGGLRAARSLR